MKSPHRLSSADFRNLRPARRVSGDFFSVSITPHSRGPKWACVVSKKVSPKAVERNLIKRRCRSVLVTGLKTFRGPVAFVFQAKRGAAQASFADIERDVRALITRVTMRGT